MKLTIDQALRQGVAAHKEGKLQDAERLYRAILQSQPNHPDANYNLGVLVVSVNRTAEALPLFRAALQANSKIEPFWLGYIDALIQLGKLDDATRILEQCKASGFNGKKFDFLKERIDEQIISNAPSDDSRLNQGERRISELITLYTQGKFNEVLALANSILASLPNNPIILNIVGAANCALQNYSDALKSYENAIGLKPDYIEAYFNLANAFNECGRYQESLSSYKKAINLKPNYVEAYNNYGNTSVNIGQYDKAISSYNKAKVINPDYVESHYNIGNMLARMEKYKEAIASFDKAITLRLNFSLAHHARGLATYKIGNYSEAVSSFNKALEITPDFADAYNNRGLVLIKLGKHSEALANYQKAIELKPNYAEAHNNRGLVLKKLDKHNEALANYQKAIELKPNYVEAHFNLGQLLRSINATSFSKSLENSYLNLLNFGNIIRPGHVVGPIIALLRHHETLKDAITQNKNNRLERLVSQFAIKLSKIPLFIKILEVCPIPDLEIENLLTNFRKILLLQRPNLSIDYNLIHFQSALALQCFTNEYIYEETEEETKAVQSLEEALQRSFLKNKELLHYDILCLASYRSLSNYEWTANLTPPKALAYLFERQVEEPSREIQIKKNIPRLNPIENSVSLAVQSQYEENPYPRWVNTNLGTNTLSTIEVINDLELKVPSRIDALADELKILIAGCGTGQHALNSATRFANNHVTAVDLSLNSLAYAKRKSDELGITNIDYLQGDLLDLGMLNKRFDIVESVGVLHHMADPIAGWKVLTNCLKSNGLMLIGLYSELARQHISKFRSVIDPKKASLSKREILRSRRQIIARSDPLVDVLQKSDDFYSTSSFRDLMFHIQEHCFTLPQIRDTLDELGLVFMGFAFSNENIKKSFKSIHSNESALYDLNIWHKYEQENPSLFAGMYQFWVQKTSDSL